MLRVCGFRGSWFWVFGVDNIGFRIDGTGAVASRAESSFGLSDRRGICVLKAWTPDQWQPSLNKALYKMAFLNQGRR